MPTLPPFDRNAVTPLRDDQVEEAVVQCLAMLGDPIDADQLTSRHPAPLNAARLLSLLNEVQANRSRLDVQAPGHTTEVKGSAEFIAEVFEMGNALDRALDLIYAFSESVRRGRVSTALLAEAERFEESVTYLLPNTSQESASASRGCAPDL